MSRWMFSRQETKVLIIVSFLTLCFLPLSLTAQETQATGTEPQPEEKVQDVQEVQPAEQKRGSALTEAAQNRIINLVENIKNRLIAVHDRLAQITTRLESRIGKVRALGIDTTATEAALLEAKTNLGNAKTTLDALPGTPRLIRSDTPRESFGILRTELTKIRDELRSGEAKLTDSIALLKEAMRNGSTSSREETGTTTITQ